MSGILVMNAVTRFLPACALALAAFAGPPVLAQGADQMAAGASAGVGAGAVPGVGAVTNLPIPRFVSLRANEANARRGPSLDQRVDWEFVHRGLPLEVTAEYGQWRRVQDADGMGGWVHHALLSGVRTALVTSGDPVPLRAEPEEGAVVRALAEPGAIGRVEACKGAWCEIAAGSVSGWVLRRVLWGVSADETIE